AIANAYLELLQAQDKIVVRGDLVASVTRSKTVLQEEEQILDAISSHIEHSGLEFTSSDVLQTTLPLSSKVFQRALKSLLNEGRVFSLPTGFLTHASAIAKVGSELKKDQWRCFTVPEFKTYFGLTRRTAIPLLEHLDAIGVTKR